MLPPHPGQRRRLAIWLLTVTLLAASLVAQQEAPGNFGEVIDVRVVNLEVVVTDHEGVRVLGLLPEDFALTVDGQEVPVEFFTEVVGGTSIAPGAAQATVPALAPGRPVGTSYLVFVDEYFAIERDRDRALRKLTEDLPLLGSEDRMAIVAYDGTTIDMLSTWSSSVETLGRVLDKASDRPTYGLQRRAELRTFRTTRPLERDAITRSFVGAPADLGLDLDLQEEAEAERIAGQVERTVLAATAALRGFANPPGRKVMILLSGGWPYNPVQWVVDDPSRVAYASQVRQGDELFAPLIEAANRLGYTLYPADVPGLSPILFDDDDVAVTGAGTFRSTRFEREQEVEHTLGRLARLTGGRAFLNSSGNDVFAGAVDDTRSYYWLGFTPTWEGSDEAHDVRVRVRRKGFDVRSRQNFTDLSRATEVTMMVESTLLFGNTPGSENLPASFGAAVRAGRGKVRVPFRLGLPLHELTFLPGAEDLRSDIELRVAVIDEDGNTAEIPVVPLTIVAKAPPSGERFETYESELKIRKKPHDIVFSIYEVATGRILSTRLRFEP